MRILLPLFIVFALSSVAHAAETPFRMEADLTGNEVSSGQWFKGSVADECRRAEKLFALFTVNSKFSVQAKCTVQKYSGLGGIQIVPTPNGGIDGRIILPEYGVVVSLSVEATLPAKKSGMRLTFTRNDSADYAETLWNRIGKKSKLHRIAVLKNDRTVTVRFSPRK